MNVLFYFLTAARSVHDDDGCREYVQAIAANGNRCGDGWGSGVCRSAWWLHARNGKTERENTIQRDAPPPTTKGTTHASGNFGGDARHTRYDDGRVGLRAHDDRFERRFGSWCIRVRSERCVQNCGRIPPLRSATVSLRETPRRWRGYRSRAIGRGDTTMSVTAGKGHLERSDTRTSYSLVSKKKKSRIIEKFVKWMPLTACFVSVIRT